MADNFEDKNQYNILLPENDLLTWSEKSIDNHFSALYGGEMILICAKSGQGKSRTLQHLAVNRALLGEHCIYFSFELNEHTVMKHINSMTNELDHTKTETINNNIHVKYMPIGTNTNDIKAYIKQYQLQTGIKPNFLFVDYLDLMDTNTKALEDTSSFKKTKIIREELHSINKEYGYVLAVAHNSDDIITDA